MRIDEIVEYSVLFGYAVGYGSLTDAYVVYSSEYLTPTAKDVITTLFEYNPDASVIVFLNDVKAKAYGDSAEWSKVIDEVNANATI